MRTAILTKSIVFSKGLGLFLSDTFKNIIIDEFIDDIAFIKSVENNNYDIVFADAQFTNALSNNDIILRSQLHTNYIAINLGNENIKNSSLFKDVIKNDITEIELKNRLEELISNSLYNKEEKQSDNTLSKREINILRHIAIGHTNKEIAELLFLSPHTVMTHRKNITRKLDIKTVSGLTVYALINNIIKMEEVKK